ncbi:hypothetical protein EV217_5088 [Phyllobacterium myrsinacearum]|nr:hypothetical protein EV217_5088 [Phyllobacterium myrsinacearum]
MSTNSNDDITLGALLPEDRKLIEAKQTLCTYEDDKQREMQSEALCLLARFIRAWAPKQGNGDTLSGVFAKKGRARFDPVVQALLDWMQRDGSSETENPDDVLRALNKVRGWRVIE